ncbi:hypothetical protein Hanom_Chr10g00961151 [Helianthus anomalus]
MAPQSLLFPKTDNALSLANTPTIGTSPSKSLYDRFKYSNLNFSKNLGICPEKLL